MPLNPSHSPKVENSRNNVIAFPKASPSRESPNKGKKYDKVRPREHLVESEVEQLLDRAKKTGRADLQHRNYTLILVMYRHALRAGEAADLQWSDIDFAKGDIYIRRLKGSNDSTHRIKGDELRALRKLQRQQEKKPSPFVFGGIAAPAISSIVKRIGEGLLAFPVHAHMLRHAAGYHLANKGVDTRIIQDYLGHANIQHTVRYTRLSSRKFEGLWD